MRYVAMHDGMYLTGRRKVNPRDPYMMRSGWSGDLEDARVFSTKGAATNSARSTLAHQTGNINDFQVLEARLFIVVDGDTVSYPNGSV